MNRPKVTSQSDFSKRLLKAKKLSEKAFEFVSQKNELLTLTLDLIKLERF
jgi:hypothetical protein